MFLELLARNTRPEKNIIGVSTNSGDVHAAGGLNWGYAKGNTGIDDAYIKLPKSQWDNDPSFFNNQDTIDVVWDDGKTMTLRLEANCGGGSTIPKQIASDGNKYILGEYLRERIGTEIGKDLLFTSSQRANKDAIPNGILNDKFITIDDLLDYGRTNIEITPLPNGKFKFDFE